MTNMKDRPGRRPVTSQERKEIVRLAMDEGLTPPQIHNRVGRDTRTIKGVLRQAKEELAAQEARVQVLRAAMEGHHADLVALARHLKESVVLPQDLLAQPQDPAVAVSGDPLYDGFREHLPRSSLWQDLASWNNASARWQGLTRDLWDRFYTDLVAESGIPFSTTVEVEGVILEEVSPSWLSGLHPVVTESAIKRIQGESSPWPPEPPYIRLIERTGHFRVSLGERDVLQITHQEPAGPLTSLSQAWDKLVKSDEFEELSKKTWPALTGSRDRAVGTLDTLILKRVFSGKCRICVA